MTTPTLFDFLDAQGFTPEQVEDLDYILDKISDFEDYYCTGIELEEEEIIHLGMDYQKRYRATHS